QRERPPSPHARGFYGRRQESVRLWIVPRAAIHDLDDPDLLQPPFDRSVKKPVGYSTEIKAKPALARDREGQGGEDPCPREKRLPRRPGARRGWGGPGGRF